MSVEWKLVAIAVVVGHFLARLDVPGRDQYEVGPRVHLKQFGVAVAAQFGVVEQAAESIAFGGRVDAVAFGFVLEKVHVAADLGFK